jgi:leucyl aminopeptidase
MTIINIYLINKLSNNNFKINIVDSLIKIKIYIKSKSIFIINSEINKINNVLNTINIIKKINIYFDKSFKNIIINSIITKINNIFYNYTSKYLLNSIKFNNIKSENINLMNELEIYKDIVMDPNKNPDTYLKYIKSRIPQNYKLKIYNLNKTNKFPISRAVGAGSQYNSYFIHIYPKKENIKNKSIYLVGKAVTFDSGGLNLKYGDMSDMKIDMIGSAIIISVLNLLAINKFDKNTNINLLFSIVENMIDNTATRPGMVFKTMSNKTIEIVNTDAEGRLCMVDCIDYANLYLIKNKNSIIIDISTLTGNATNITTNMSSITTSNKKGIQYINKLINIGDNIGEYVDYLIMREEYYSLLKSTVADIKNINYNIKADCIMAGVFLSTFIVNEIPWIHIDLGGIVYSDNKVVSYGIHLLYEFIKQI